MSNPFRTRTNAPKHPGTPVTEGKSATQQQFEADSNINNITQRFFKTGVLSTMGKTRNSQPIFGDISHLEYEKMLNQTADIQAMWMGLRASLRNRFGSASNLLRWVENPANYEEAVKLGLIVKTSLEVDPNQVDLVKESEKMAPKADDDAQPQFKGGEKPPA